MYFDIQIYIISFIEINIYIHLAPVCIFYVYCVYIFLNSDALTNNSPVCLAIFLLSHGNVLRLNSIIHTKFSKEFRYM